MTASKGLVKGRLLVAPFLIRFEGSEIHLKTYVVHLTKGIGMKVAFLLFWVLEL